MDVTEFESLFRRSCHCSPTADLREVPGGALVCVCDAPILRRRRVEPRPQLHPVVCRGCGARAFACGACARCAAPLEAQP